MSILGKKIFAHKRVTAVTWFIQGIPDLIRHFGHLEPDNRQRASDRVGHRRASQREFDGEQQYTRELGFCRAIMMLARRNTSNDEVFR
jgi:hypothetical protein